MYDESLRGAADPWPGEEYRDPAALLDSATLLRQLIPEPRRSPEGE
ncbi:MULTISPECIES: hypothetical protein [Prauserella salsuginis group]|uniref:Uncharacterized protein n=2 Tax=Prauserella salsuginis group TaxID=2893672 RepID=A0A839XHR8_9PSEU|nr:MULTISPECIES: hypothetical protein [Prauserella salsuginis group]MBB3662027.1 hypothetical protein [Prauserella sediminis]MCR3719724.1 hypothetical protein [Prauserella flava]MCR3736733.1 hypothetical protein [Prauserella salsuginis]